MEFSGKCRRNALFCFWFVCLTAIWKNRALDCSLHLQSTNTSHQPISVCLCRGSRLLIAKLLKSISQSWPQSASSNRPLHSTRLQNGQVKGKVENEDEQSRIVQSSNQKSSPRVRLLAVEASSNDGRQSSNLSTLLEEAEQLVILEASLGTLKRIACTNCEQKKKKTRREQIKPT